MRIKMIVVTIYQYCRNICVKNEGKHSTVSNESKQELISKYQDTSYILSLILS